MEKLGTKGFSPIEGLLITIIVLLVAGVSFYVYSENKNSGTPEVTANETNKTPNKSTEDNDKNKVVLPDDWTQFNESGVSFAHPKSWSKSDAPADRAEVAKFSDNSSSISAYVYKNNPRMYYSSNAPFYCQLDADKWQHYEFSGTKNSDKRCDDIQKKTLNDHLVHSIAGGALGQYAYTVTVELKENEYVVLRDYRNLEGYGADNIGTMEELKSSLDAFVEKFTKLN